MEKTKDRLIQFLYQCPPILVILGSMLICFAAGYLVGRGMAPVPGMSVGAISYASFSALVFGYCGSILFLMRKD